MPATAKFLEAKERMREAKAEAARIAQEAFKESAADLFTAHPRLESFGWNQYTPYFNDGDECVFGAHIDYPKINGEDEDDSDTLRKERWVGGEKPWVPNENYDAELGAALDGVKEFLRAFDDEDFKSLFGDHLEITVSRDGTISTDQYEHD